MAPGMMTIYYWELQDGELVTPANQPEHIALWTCWVVTLGSCSSTTYLLDDDSGSLFVILFPSTADEDDETQEGKKGSRFFHIFSPYMEVTEMNPFKIMPIRTLRCLL